MLVYGSALSGYVGWAVSKEEAVVMMEKATDVMVKGKQSGGEGEAWEIEGGDGD